MVRPDYYGLCAIVLLLCYYGSCAELQLAGVATCLFSPSSPILQLFLGVKHHIYMHHIYNVYYKHLTLTTNREVLISVVAL